MRGQLLMQWLKGESPASPPLAVRHLPHVRHLPDARHLYQKIYARLYVGLGGSVADAEDATQATFLAAIESHARIRKGLPEFVSGVSRMKILEHCRRRGRRMWMVSVPDLDDRPDEHPIASSTIETAREVDLLVVALQELAIVDQRCLALVYGRELRNVEAAAALGLTEVVFNSRIGHARRRLRKALERIGSTGSAQRRSAPSFPQWVESVLGRLRRRTAACSR